MWNAKTIFFFFFFYFDPNSRALLFYHKTQKKREELVTPLHLGKNFFFFFFPIENVERQCHRNGTCAFFYFRFVVSHPYYSVYSNAIESQVLFIYAEANIFTTCQIREYISTSDRWENLNVLKKRRNSKKKYCNARGVIILDFIFCGKMSLMEQSEKLIGENSNFRQRSNALGHYKKIILTRKVFWNLFNLFYFFKAFIQKLSEN